MKPSKAHTTQHVPYSAGLARSKRDRFASINGDAVKGFGSTDCTPLKGVSIDMGVSWKNQSDLSILNESAVRLRFELKNASLYSFWIE